MKKAAIALAIVVLALVGLVFLLPLALNSDTLRTALARQLSEASGADIALNGPIHFSVVPDFGIVVEDLAYATADGTVSVTAARSVASVEPMSLLSSQVRITGIELRSPRIILGEVTAPVEPAAASQADVADDGDIFKLIGGYLERLSIDSVVVTDGEVARSEAGAVRLVASDIELHLSVPGISEPASLSASGTIDGDRMAVAANIGSLRDLLARQPAEFSFSTTMEHPVHPALADLSASGSIQLAEDGSYRITGGEIDSIGQTMRLDASYAPGDRPFVMARIAAGTLDYSDFQPAEPNAVDAASEAPGTSGDGPDLSALRNIDADIQLHADALRAGDAIARDVTIGARLQSGQLDTSLNSGEIAGGSLAASMLMDVNADIPQASGSLDVSSIDIESLMALAGQVAPASGQLSSQLQYAFRGADTDTIRDSLNLRGEVSIAEGRIDIPQLGDVAGPGADVVDALNATARIEDVLQPLNLSGTARWNGEAISFASSLTLSDLFWQQKGEVALDFKSQPLNANFSGTLSPDGAVAGQADVAAASLSRALGWFGQDTGTALGQFDFSGGISVSSTALSMTDATIGLDGMHAEGSLSVETVGKPKITAALSVDTLDFSALTGAGGDEAGTSAAGSGPAAIDLSILRQFNADIRLAASQLGYGKVRAGPATATLSIVDGIAKLTVPQAGFYEGTVTASVTANGAGDVPAIDLVAGMEGVQGLPLLTSAAGFDRIEGRLKASVQVTGSGTNTEAFARSLNGPVNVVFSDGAIRGIDVAGLVRNVQGLISAGYSENTEAKTEFTELSVAIDIQNGVGRAEDIRLLGPFVRMSGKGSIDLAAQTIDMQLDPRVVGSLDGQGGSFDVAGLGMPIIVRGPLSGPSIYPDITGILADPNRALQALSQLGGGAGELANNASGALGGLGEALGGDPGALADGVMTDLIGQLGGGQPEAGAGGTPFGEQELLNSLLGGVLGQQAPASAQAAPSQQPVQPVETATQTNAPVQAPPEAIPLPRPDPRGGWPAAPTPAPEPEIPATPTEGPVDTILPQLAPEAGGETTDLINNLIQQIGQ